MTTHTTTSSCSCAATIYLLTFNIQLSKVDPPDFNNQHECFYTAVLLFLSAAAELSERSFVFTAFVCLSVCDMLSEDFSLVKFVFTENEEFFN